MSRKIVCTGRGGTGKTTFVALAALCLDSHPLLIDADSDQNLADMLGVDLEKEKIKTISEILFDIQKKKNTKELNSLSLPEKIEYLLNFSCLYESEDFDLISIGVKWTQGCYCMPNNILRSILPKLAESYRYTIIDSPGGLEHLNRRIVSEVDDIFVIIDPTVKALKNMERLKKIASEVGISYKNIYLVGNYRFKREKEKLAKSSGNYLGKIKYDPELEEYTWNGRSLTDLSQNSPAFSSTREILKKAGYM